MDSPWPASSESLQSCPTYMGGPNLKSWQNHLLVDPDWDTKQGPRKCQTHQTTPKVDLCRDWEFNTPSLVERDQSKWESFYGQWQCEGKLQWLQGLILCKMAGNSLQAARHTTGGLRVVGCPTLFCGLYPQDFMPITDTSGPKDFWVVRKEKTLALSWALQACARESLVPIGILSDACMRASDMYGPLDYPHWGWHS